NRAVRGNALRRHLHHGQHRGAEEVVHVQKLAQAGGLGFDHVVGQHHRERLVAHQFPGAQYRVPQSQGLLLAHVGHADQIGNAADDGQQLLLFARLQQVFQLEADIEMVLDGALAAARYHDDVLNARVDRLLHPILDDRLVHDGQHFFGLRLGGGKKAGAEPGGRENSFSNFSRHLLQFGASGARLATSELFFPVRLCYVLIPGETTTMAYVIAEPCIGTKDTACVDACPVDCIHPKKDEANFAAAEMLYIDPVECIDCGACVPVCPVSAIFALDDLPEKWAEFTAKNAAYYRK